MAKTPAKPVTKTVAKPAPKTPAKSVSAPKVPSKQAEKKPEPAFQKFELRTNKPTISKPAPAAIEIKEPEIETGNTKRYSDSDLEEFRQIINQKLSVSREELANLMDQLQNPGINAGDDTDNSYKTLDDGSSTAEKEQIGQLAARLRKFIENLEHAMMRIENKTYGICRVTGKLISKERLRAVPHTTLSMEAKMQQYK
ncbi:MAG: TraR/DksA family transcriptional regulator [Bacteroidota bacterium]